MATIHTGDMQNRGIRHRGEAANKVVEYTGRVFIPNGTALEVGDDILGLRVAENQTILEVNTTVVGNLGAALRADIGYFQVLDSAGDAVEVQRKGPSGPANTKFASPTTDPNAYATAADVAGQVETLVDPAAATAGPVDIGMRITTRDDSEADTYVYITVKMLGEAAAPGEFEGNDAYQYGDRYGL